MPAKLASLPPCKLSKKAQRAVARSVGRAYADSVVRDWHELREFLTPERAPAYARRHAEINAFMYYPGAVSCLLHSFSGRIAERLVRRAVAEGKLS